MSTCQQCSTPLPGDAPRGMCPACLLSTGLGLDVEFEDQAPGLVLDLGGRYRLGEVLGEGGFGTVYRTEQVEPVRREVAVKILKPGMAAAGQVLARFEAEGQALAMMDHANIASVLDAGEAEDGRPYFVMELVDGAPITEHCDAHGLSLEERLQLFRKVADAVAHAHQKGIIHRDLKPSNILVSKAGEPSVIDFGIAKALAEPLTERTMYTKVHQAMGTPAYMSPEQCGGHEGGVDTRSDVYALGAVLYELVCGRPPFAPDELAKLSYAEIIETLRKSEPSAPSVSNKSLPRELDWICAKALAKEPSRRYGGAGELGRELGRFLNSETLAAGPPSRVYALRKLVARNRGVFIAGALAALALVVGSVASLSLYLDSVMARRQVEAGRDALQRSYVQRDLHDGRNAAHSGRASDALAHYCSALRGDPENEIATSHLLGLLLHRRWVRPLTAPVKLPALGEPIAMAADAIGGRGFLLCEGGRVAVVSGGAVSVMEGGADAQGLIVTPGSGELVVVRKHEVAGVSSDSAITAWDVVEDRRAPALIVGCESGEIFWVDLQSGEKREAVVASSAVRAIVAGEQMSAGFAFSTGKAVYGVLWPEKQLRLLTRGEEAASDLMMFRPAQAVAVAAGDGVGIFGTKGQWKVESLGQVGRVSGGFDFLPAGRMLLTGGADSYPRLWRSNLVSGEFEPIRHADNHARAIEAVRFTRDGRSALSVCAEGTGRVWDVLSGRGEPLRAGGRLDEVAIDADAKLLVSYDGRARTVTLWGFGRISAWPPRVDWFEGVDKGASEQPEGVTFADRIIKLSSGVQIRAAGEVNAVAVSADGQRLASCADGRTLQLWRCRDGTELCPRWLVDLGARELAFHGDDLLRVSFGDRSVRWVPLPPAGARLDPAFLAFAEGFACRRAREEGSLETVPAAPLESLAIDAIVSTTGRHYAEWLIESGDSRLLWPGAQWSIEGYGEELKGLGRRGEKEAARIGLAWGAENLKNGTGSP